MANRWTLPTIVLEKFFVNDVDESSPITYVGMEDAGGNWLVMKIDESSGVSISYATIKNNSDVSSYSNAWSDRASLSYGNFSEVM